FYSAAAPMFITLTAGFARPRHAIILTTHRIIIRTTHGTLIMAARTTTASKPRTDTVFSPPLAKVTATLPLCSNANIRRVVYCRHEHGYYQLNAHSRLSLLQ